MTYIDSITYQERMKNIASLINELPLHSLEFIEREFYARTSAKGFSFIRDGLYFRLVVKDHLNNRGIITIDRRTNAVFGHINKESISFHSQHLINDFFKIKEVHDVLDTCRQL